MCLSWVLWAFIDAFTHEVYLPSMLRIRDVLSYSLACFYCTAKHYKGKR